MFRSFFKRSQRRRFEPLFSLAEVEAYGRLPVVEVFPFVPASESSAGGAAGPGVGGLLANLVRRNLLLTRQISVLSVEDTGFMVEPDAEDDETDSANRVSGGLNIHIVGRLTAQNASRTRLDLRILRREAEPEGIRFSFSHARVTDVAAFATKQLASRLQLQVTPETAEGWQIGKPLDWEGLCLAATCWERDDLTELVALAETRRSHPDALAPLSDRSDPALQRRAFKSGTEEDPFNAQLLFYLFCVIWKGNTRHQPEAAQLLRRALECAPGHGKSHMCLPHVTPFSAENNPYILAHSQTGYQLLRANSFALSNFCNYLKVLAPDDPHIGELVLATTALDPYSPAGYCDAIEYLLSHDRPFEALEFARDLVRLCTPPLNDRTIYCFRQNPSVAADMDRGRFDPAQFARHYIDACNKRLGNG